MKPPVRGNGFVVYSVSESEDRKWNALKDFIEKLPFLVVIEPEVCKALMVYKPTTLMVLKGSQATSLDSKIVDTIKNSVHKKEVSIMTNRKALLVVLAMVLLAFACYKFGYSRGAKSCVEVKALNITPTNTPKVNPAPSIKKASPAPVRETRTEESYNELVFVNQLGAKVPVEYEYKGVRKEKFVNESFMLKVTSSELNVLVNHQPKTFKFKSDRGGRIVYKIKG